MLALTDEEISAFRDKTTETVRKKYRELRREGKTATHTSLVGGPLDGVPHLHADSRVVGWCHWTRRGVVVAHYRLDQSTGEWMFSELFRPGG